MYSYITIAFELDRQFCVFRDDWVDDDEETTLHWVGGMRYGDGMHDSSAE